MRNHWITLSLGALLSLPASAQLTEDQKSKLATLINLNGDLCARVTGVRSRGNSTFDVDCIRYRDGTGAATYLVDLKTGRVK